MTHANIFDELNSVLHEYTYEHIYNFETVPIKTRRVYAINHRIFFFFFYLLIPKPENLICINNQVFMFAIKGRPFLPDYICSCLAKSSLSS